MSHALRLYAASCAALAFSAFALVSAAEAQSPTLPFPGKYKTSVEIRGYPGDSSCIQLYTAPSPYSLAITDLALDSYGSTTAVPYQYICSGAPTCAAARSAYMTAPAGNTMVQNFTTAIIINSGETLSVCNYGGIGKITSWTFHGVLFTPPTGSPNGPASASAFAQKGMPNPTPPRPSER